MLSDESRGCVITLLRECFSAVFSMGGLGWGWVRTGVGLEKKKKKKHTAGRESVLYVLAAASFCNRLPRSPGAEWMNVLTCAVCLFGAPKVLVAMPGSVPKSATGQPHVPELSAYLSGLPTISVAKQPHGLLWTLPKCNTVKGHQMWSWISGAGL